MRGSVNTGCAHCSGTVCLKVETENRLFTERPYHHQASAIRLGPQGHILASRSQYASEEKSFACGSSHHHTLSGSRQSVGPDSMANTTKSYCVRAWQSVNDHGFQDDHSDHHRENRHFAHACIDPRQLSRQGTISHRHVRCQSDAILTSVGWSTIHSHHREQCVLARVAT